MADYGIFDNFDWGGIAQDAIKGFAAAAPAAVTGYYGARKIAQGNQQAVDTVAANNVAAANAIAASNAEAARLAAEGRDRAVQAVTAGSDKARAVIEPVVAQGNAIAEPGLQYMRGVMATNPYSLTPQQAITLKDNVRSSVRATPAYLRGNGRTVASIGNDVYNRGKGALIAQNMGRADNAAATLTSTGNGRVTAGTNALAGIATDEGRSVASLESSGGDKQAQITQQTGQAGANALQNTGQAAADAITGTAASNASTIGQIGSFFANQVNDNARENRYKAYSANAGRV